MVPSVVIRPIELPTVLVNHRFSSGPVVIENGHEISGWEKTVMVPSVVIRPIESLLVNHRFSSGPVVINCGWEISGWEKIVMVPSVVIRPIESLSELVNHRFASGPAVIKAGHEISGWEKIVMVPAGLASVTPSVRSAKSAPACDPIEVLRATRSRLCRGNRSSSPLT